MSEYEKGWIAAFDYLASYIETEICPVTGEMIRRMKDEAWRFDLERRDGPKETP